MTIFPVRAYIAQVRTLLPLLAVLALLISPVTAAAAQQHCAMGGLMSMAAEQAPSSKAQTDPCCDPGKQSPHNDEACAQACATMCGVVSVLPTSVVSTMVPVRALFATQIADQPRAHSPPISERPPKLIA